MKLFVVGDSHVQALEAGRRLIATTDPTALNDWDVTCAFVGPNRFMRDSFFQVVDDGVEVTAAGLTERLSQSLPDCTIRLEPDTVYAISLGFHSQRVAAHGQWTQFVPWQLRAEFPLLTPLSNQTVEEIILADCRPTFGFYATLRRLGFPLVAVAAPPLHDDHPAIVERGTPPRIIVELHAIHREVVSSHLRELGIPVVLPPAEAYDDHGFLESRLRAPAAKDVYHANGEYGALMLPRVLAAATA